MHEHFQSASLSPSFDRWFVQPWAARLYTSANHSDRSQYFRIGARGGFQTHTLDCRRWFNQQSFDRRRLWSPLSLPDAPWHNIICVGVSAVSFCKASHRALMALLRTCDQALLPRASRSHLARSRAWTSDRSRWLVFCSCVRRFDFATQTTSPDDTSAMGLVGVMGGWAATCSRP